MYKEKNEELMCRYKAGEHELLWELVELNMGICYKFAHKYHLSGLDFDDMVSMMKGFLIEAIEKYDPSKGTAFSTYAYIVMSTRFLNVLRNNNIRELDVVSIDTPIGENITIQDCLEDLGMTPLEQLDYTETNKLLKEVVMSLNDEEKEIITRLFIHGHTQREVAKYLGCNQVTVSRKSKKILNKLRLKLERLTR